MAVSPREALLRGLDGELPQGGDWHHTLLVRATRPGPGRPPAIRAETRTRLEDLLRFRHFLRHAYAVELDWGKMSPLVAEQTGSH